jgi:hypothetical protein
MYGARLFVTVEQREKTSSSPAETAETVWVRRLREDARRPISVNLAEWIALRRDVAVMSIPARTRPLRRGVGEKLVPGFR